MRCKKHFADDLSSGDGVCATCLRDRLLIVIEAQIQADLQPKLEKTDCRSSSEGSSTPDCQVEFQRSDSPDVGCRKLDYSSVQSQNGHVVSADHRFYSTPQVVNKKKQNKNSIVSNFFRSKPNDLVSDPDFDLKAMESCSVTSTSWLSSVFASKQKKVKKKKKKSCVFTLSDPNASRVMQRPCRGMSPADESDGELCDGNAPESSPQWKETPLWKETPQRTTAPAPAQFRCKRMNQARNLTGFSFCLSPVVRPSYNRNQKGTAPDIAFAGDVRIPVKPHIGIASRYCPNRSKKLADCGKSRPNY